MSEPKNPTEDHQASSTTPDKTKQDRKMKRRSSLQKIIFGIAIGIMIGVLFTQKVVDYLPNILPTLMAVTIAFFVLLTILILALPSISNYLIKRYTGKEMDVESVAGDIQKKTNSIADAIANVVLVKANPEVKRNIRTNLPDILHYLIFSRLRSGGLRLLLTVFAAVGGLMGTILLYNQNQLLQAQNRKIDIQTSLMESERRGSQVVLMGNVLEDMSAEIQRQKDEGARNDSTGYELSSSLIGRIAATSQGFMPYKFLQGDTLTAKEYSLERGQLLLALVNSRLDSLSMERINRSCTFLSAYLNGFNLREARLYGADLYQADLRGADLQRANLREVDLGGADLRLSQLVGINLRGANLRGANLGGANLREADLRGGDLYRANLRGAMLSNTDFREAILIRANLREVKLNGTNLYRTGLGGADLRGADFLGANLLEADLGGANLHGAKNINSEMLRYCRSLYRIQGLPDSLSTLFKAKIDNMPSN